MNPENPLVQYWPVVITYLLFNFFLTKITNDSKHASAHASTALLDLSAFERFFYLKSSVYSNIVYLLLILANLNFVIFLFYFGYKTVWYYPIILIILSFANSAFFVPVVQRLRTIKIIVTLLQFLLLPILAILLWYFV